jgi:ectoine hydroxylase-related dioxygenase (phytanoyl-CoA dioxygenase family)
MNDYERRGYLIVPDVVEPALLMAMHREATAICRGVRGGIAGVSTATADEDDDAVLRRYLCIHFPHKMSPLLREIARLPAVVDVLTAVIGPNVKMMQSMLFIKAPGKPGQAWHQDESHIPTRDRSLTAVWIALDDATAENGCLWVIPGSHRAGVLHPVRDQRDPRFDQTPEAHGFEPSDREAVPVELPAGSALVFSGYLLHRSLPNSHPFLLRRCLVNHYMSAESLLPWLPPGQDDTMATTDFRDILLIAGTDPHAAKGTVDVMQPRVRLDDAR